VKKNFSRFTDMPDIYRKPSRLTEMEQ